MRKGKNKTFSGEHIHLITSSYLEKCDDADKSKTN